MSTYNTEVDLGEANNSQTQAYDLVGEGKDVLDVGCWKGDLGRALATNGCRVSGVDFDEAAAAVAREAYDHVVVADLNTTPLSACFPPASFDVIVFADVLEHVLEPARVLADAATLLREGGYVVLSIPNVTHGSVRLALLQGRWDYTEAGLLDRTHVRFFSRRGLVDLVSEAGYVMDELRSTVVDVLSREVVYDHDALPPAIIEWVRDQPDAMTFQFMVRAHPSTGASTTSQRTVPALVPAVPTSLVRPVDRYTEQLVRERDKDHRLLTQRDHIIGLEATAASAMARAVAAERGLDRRLDRKNDTIERLRGRIRKSERRVAQLEDRPPRRSVASKVATRLRLVKRSDG